MTMRLPELLAPAGNAACALAAFDAGADAVYAGLKQFNARERTGNFTLDELTRVIAYAHKIGRKVYVTLNTLIKESEVTALASYLHDLEQIGPDAVIVQDLGVIHMCREYFPGLTIHASTQMGIHNSDGIAAAEKLGVKRVILERQTSLDEIEIISRKHPEMELEVFIHGALCCCVSGSCLLSSWLGGWSGNRGKCKQPCRRRYHSASGNGFFLSVQDLCSLDLLPRMLKAGVVSLKIEGRLRRSDYVTEAVGAYRMLLDNMASPNYSSLIPAARERMAHTYGRKWSEGFYTGASKQTLVKADALGAAGQLCGSVLSSRDNALVIQVTKRIHIGDAIRVQPKSGDEGPAFSVTRMSVDGQLVHRAVKGDICTIFTDRTAYAGDLVYKTGESCGDYSRRIAALPMPLPKLSADIRLQRTLLTVSISDGSVFSIPLDLQTAATHPVKSDVLRKEFSGVIVCGMELVIAKVDAEDSLFLPASVLKSLRKQFQSWAEDTLNPEQIQTIGRSNGLERLLADYADMKHTSAPYPETVILPRRQKAPDPNMTVARMMEENPSPHEEFILPFYIPEKELQQIRQRLSDFVAKGGHVVRVTAMHHFTLLEDFPDLLVRTSFPLPICNSFAVKEMKRLGASSVQAWIELEKKELDGFARKSCLPVEQVVYARPILLSTRATIPVSGDMSDARGNVFTVKKNGVLTQITPDKLMKLPRLQRFDSYVTDFRNEALSMDQNDVATFNFDYELK